MTTTAPLFPNHRDFSATPTGIIDAAWLMSRPEVVRMARDLSLMSKGDAIRHKRLVCELTKLDNGRWAYLFMTTSRKVKARFLIDAGTGDSKYDTVNDDARRFHEAVKGAYWSIAKILYVLNVLPSNSLPVRFNEEAPYALKTTHKAWKEARDLNMWMGWVA